MTPQDYYNEHAYRLNKAQFWNMFRNAPISDAMIRFQNHLDDFILGVSCFENDTRGKFFVLIFAEEKQEFQSILLELPIDEFQLANDVTSILVRRIQDISPKRDYFSLFNTFQGYRQSALESMGYFTFNPLTLPKGDMIFGFQKPAPVMLLERKDFLQTLYGNTNDQPHLDPKNKIYLMVDDSNGNIKIGLSKHPEYREGTLQSKEPRTYLFAQWTAPRNIETYLHRRYAQFRVRGEWFNLTFKELDEIKAFMDGLTLENINEGK